MGSHGPRSCLLPACQRFNSSRDTAGELLSAHAEIGELLNDYYKWDADAIGYLKDLKSRISLLIWDFI